AWGTCRRASACVRSRRAEGCAAKVWVRSPCPRIAARAVPATIAARPKRRAALGESPALPHRRAARGSRSAEASLELPPAGRTHRRRVDGLAEHDAVVVVLVRARVDRLVVEAHPPGARVGTRALVYHGLRLAAGIAGVLRVVRGAGRRLDVEAEVVRIHADE